MNEHTHRYILLGDNGEKVCLSASVLYVTMVTAKRFFYFNGNFHSDFEKKILFEFGNGQNAFRTVSKTVSKLHPFKKEYMNDISRRDFKSRKTA